MNGKIIYDEHHNPRVIIYENGGYAKPVAIVETYEVLEWAKGIKNLKRAAIGLKKYGEREKKRAIRR